MLHHNAVTVLLTLHFPVSNAPIVFLALFVNYCLYLHNPFSFALIMRLQYLMYVYLALCWNYLHTNFDFGHLAFSLLSQCCSHLGIASGSLLSRVLHKLLMYMIYVSLLHCMPP